MKRKYSLGHEWQKAGEVVDGEKGVIVEREIKIGNVWNLDSEEGKGKKTSKGNGKDGFIDLDEEKRTDRGLHKNMEGVSQRKLKDSIKTWKKSLKKTAKKVECRRLERIS